MQPLIFAHQILTESLKECVQVHLKGKKTVIGWQLDQQCPTPLCLADRSICVLTFALGFEVFILLEANTKKWNKSDNIFQGL